MQNLFQDAYSQVKGQFVPGLMGPNQWAKIPSEVLKSLLKELMIIANFYQLANPDWDRAACDKAAYIYYCRERLPFLDLILKGQKGQLANPVPASDIPKILSGKKAAANMTMLENKQFTDLAIVNQAALPSEQLDAKSMWGAAHAAAILPPPFTGVEDLSLGDLHAPPMGILELNKQYNPELFTYEPTV